MHMWLYLNGEQMWSPHVSFDLPDVTSLKDIGPWVKRRARLEEWQLKCRQAVQLLSETVFTVNRRSAAYFYGGLTELVLDDVQRETLGFDGNHPVRKNIRAGVFG